MRTNVIDFSEKKKRMDDSIVYVGDFVEWKDYDGEVYESKVISIEHMPVEGVPVGDSLESFPLWEKAEYTVMMSHGLTIIGDVIIRKISKKSKKMDAKIVKPRGMNYK